jgi:hypothetical protein
MLHLPTIFDWIQRFDFMRGLPAAYLALAMAFIIVVVWDWRVSVLALAVLYFAAGLLFLDILDPRLAVVKLLVGWFICIMLYFTARQANWGRLPEDVGDDEAVLQHERRHLRFGRFVLPSSTVFRIFLGLLVALVVLAIYQRPAYQLPAVSPPVNLAILALGGLGLIGMALTSEPLKAGMGLLIFLTGFQLFYNALEQSVALLVFLAAGDLFLMLVISYLTQARHALPALVQKEG